MKMEALHLVFAKAAQIQLYQIVNGKTNIVPMNVLSVIAGKD